MQDIETTKNHTEDTVQNETVIADMVTDSTSKKKQHLWKNTILLLLLCSFWTVVGVFVGSMFFPKKVAVESKTDSNTVSEIEEGDSAVSVETKFETLQEIIDKYYYHEFDSKEQEENFYKAYIESLGDKYSVYYSAEEFQTTVENINGTYYGIGAVVSQTEDKEIILLQIYEGSPAEKAGLLANDILIAIDGVTATGMTVDEAVALVKGEKGTEVTLSIKREDTEFDAVVTRDAVDIPSVYGKIKEDDIGYIQISGFDVATTTQFTKTMEELLSQGAKGFVIDLRNNGGGALDTAVDMLDYFFEDELLVYIEDKYDNRQNYYAEEGSLDESIPLAVLINGNSASASEVFAGALQDWERAKIFGTKSYGKGVVQNLLTLSDGSGLKITTSMYFTPLGRNFNGNGIEPDEEVPFPTDEEAFDEQGYLLEEYDAQLNAAVSYLKEKL